MGSLLIPQQYVYWYVGHYLPPSHHAIGSPSQVLQLIELFTELHQISARTGESTFQNKITVLFLEVLNASEKWFNTLTLSQLPHLFCFSFFPKKPVILTHFWISKDFVSSLLRETSTDILHSYDVENDFTLSHRAILHQNIISNFKQFTVKMNTISARAGESHIVN